MSSDGMPADLTQLRERAAGRRIFYEIFPVLICEVANAPFDWFEVVLHAEVDAGPEVVALLRELAQFVGGRISADVPCDLCISNWYYTIQPPPAGEGFPAVRLFRSLTLMISGIPSYGKDEPRVMTLVKRELEGLEIPPTKTALQWTTAARTI